MAGLDRSLAPVPEFRRRTGNDTVAGRSNPISGCDRCLIGCVRVCPARQHLVCADTRLRPYHRNLRAFAGSRLPLQCSLGFHRGDGDLIHRARDASLHVGFRSRRFQTGRGPLAALTRRYTGDVYLVSRAHQRSDLHDEADRRVQSPARRTGGTSRSFLLQNTAVLVSA